MALSEAGVRTYVARILGQDGSDGVVVELTTNQINECMADALRVYNRYRPKRTNQDLALISGVQKYVLTTYGKGLVDCQPRPTVLPSASNFDLFNPFHFLRRSIQVNEVAIDMAHLGLARQVLSSQFEWNYDEDTHTLYIHPIPNEITTVVYTYLSDRTIGEVRGDDEDWFLRYVTCLCKQPLGRMRSKYAVVRGAEHEFQMDGDSLLAEFREDREKMEQEIRNRGGDLGLPTRM